MKQVINSRKRYTKEEDDYISEKWGILSIKCIANKLGRTTTGIEKRAERLGLGGFVYAQDVLTTGDCANIVKVDNTTIINWIKTFGLKAKFKKINKKRIYRIELKDFISFLENNKHLWNAAKVEEYSLAIEYEWLIEKRKEDRKLLNSREKTQWTTKEELEAINYFRAGLSSAEVAEKLKRTPIALRKKRADFIRRGIEGIKPSPIWTEYQKTFVIKNWSKMSIDDISDIIEKPAHLIERFGWEHKLGERFKVSEGYYTFLEVAQLLNIHRSTILYWYKNKGLKAIESNKGNKKRLVISIEDLTIFLKENNKYNEYRNYLEKIS